MHLYLGKQFSYTCYDQGFFHFCRISVPYFGIFRCRDIFTILAQMAIVILASLIFTTCRYVAKIKHNNLL